ncbi:hypothetical protein HELRODRAFT_164146 [Helobdella robusta]|uniref:Uncharacterized protein n=1 Tax=Helobdella robusta TaxID=6412 RepID=T1EV02_HELRO|nr:hypothetical protein HELRODRAFT_164146 [Helobdella robusta]ESN94326.1 hypothetical protein HELRODRAFT_164146 [Helobdella robusta]
MSGAVAVWKNLLCTMDKTRVQPIQTNTILLFAPAHYSWFGHTFAQPQQIGYLDVIEETSNRNNNPTNNVDGTTPAPAEVPTSLASPTPNKIESTLPGVKLPKSLAQWLEANAFFQLHQQSLPNYDNIDEFTHAFQQMIYNYFAKNYGTIKT